jgi:hypothetical protein
MKFSAYNERDNIKAEYVGMIKSEPNELIARKTDWRFLNELKRESGRLVTSSDCSGLTLEKPSVSTCG